MLKVLFWGGVLGLSTLADLALTWLVVLPVVGLATVGGWLLARLMVLPVRGVRWFTRLHDAAELEWLLACTERRLAARKRVNLRVSKRVTLRAGAGRGVR